MRLTKIIYTIIVMIALIGCEKEGDIEKIETKEGDGKTFCESISEPKLINYKEIHTLKNLKDTIYITKDEINYKNSSVNIKETYIFGVKDRSKITIKHHNNEYGNKIGYYITGEKNFSRNKF